MLLILLLYAFYEASASTSYAFEFSRGNVTRLSANHSVWKPSGVVTLEEGVICARAVQENCSSCKNTSTAVCTFDKGSTFSVEQTHYAFCGDRGVIVDGSLLCPHKVQNISGSAINVSTVSYRGNMTLTENLTDDKVLSFFHNLGDVTSIEFPGNTIFLNDEKMYLMNAVLNRGNASSMHVLFESYNGVSWTVRSRIPLSVISSSTLVAYGDRRIVVSVDNTSERYIVSSAHGGKWWGTVRKLNASNTVATLSLDSGIVVESGLSNLTNVLELAGTVGHKHGSKVIKIVDLYKDAMEVDDFPDNFTACNDALECTTSSFIGLASFSKGSATVLFDYLSKRTQLKTIVGVTVHIDDSEEKKEILEMKRKAEEEAKRREEARIKAQREWEEKQQKEREERRKREEERRARFKKNDERYLEEALSKAVEDGEMIVVREVEGEWIDLEKQSFFW
ncbi:hypothetical protein ERJ75_000940000 [Trypanosoma vivax]|uniref:Uncharacterized protein n=1 Tax=Trypanosoma vivax (strain Y486) TaxID=1055687 RepID=G0U4F0_TRYVY|nr:hypothetical protein TRVL_02946 [Trypanosoma vivax]KAH8612035.1 hypothetical protein ERJ75_000940000 [Trypanosoma vivax]CCC52314.1 conserved hypothetical protein [Trypanosoma vivax Y486]